MSQKNYPPTETLNLVQKRNLEKLKADFGLSQAALDRCRFFGQDEPWIPPDILQGIANDIGTFSYVGIEFSKYVRELEQHIWTATVVDDKGRTYVRPGVATIGEESGSADEADGLNIDAHLLAQGRALQAALGAAGFHPFKPGFRFKKEPELPSHTGEAPTEREIELQRKADESALRGKDLRQIHALAEECGLIIGEDRRNYRRWLKANYGGVETAAVLNASERASVINALSQFGPEDQFLNAVPLDLIADAMIA